LPEDLTITHPGSPAATRHALVAVCWCRLCPVVAGTEPEPLLTPVWVTDVGRHVSGVLLAWEQGEGRWWGLVAWDAGRGRCGSGCRRPGCPRPSCGRDAGRDACLGLSGSPHVGEPDIGSGWAQVDDGGDWSAL
jgi:hypothetical protein